MAGINSRTYKIVPLSDLDIDEENGFYKAFNDMRKVNQELKTLIAFNLDLDDDDEVFSFEHDRKVFVDSVEKFLDEYHFNGFHLEWVSNVDS